MPEHGFRALGIWLAVVCMLIALAFPLHQSVISTNVGLDKVDARPFDVLKTSWSEVGETLLSSSILAYAQLPSTDGLLLSMNYIWILCIGLGIILLLLEYFRAEHMHRFNQFAILGTLIVTLGMVAFYYGWSAYLTAQYGIQFIATTSAYSTGLGVGFYGAIFGAFIGFLVVLEGYIEKD